MEAEEFLFKCSKLSKELAEKQGDPLNPKDKVPEYYAGYKKMVEDYRENKVHAYGEFPSKLFAAMKPLQTEEEFQYVESTYQPVTKDTFVDFSNTVKKSLINGSIEWNDKNERDDDLENYLDKKIENHGNVMEFVAAMIDEKLIDANGIIAIWPKKYDLTEEGEIIGLVYPQPYIYNVEQVVWKGEDEYIVLTEEYSKVSYASKEHYCGRVYRYFGKEYLYEAKQYGKYINHTFELSFELEHMVGFTPAQRMKGIAKIVRNEIVYQSIFDLAVPHLNLAAVDSSNLLTIKNKVGYPTRVVVREKCTHSENGAMCEGGFLQYFDGESEKKKTCPNCRGTGFIGVFGAMSELVVNNTPSGIQDERNQSVNAGNAMAYVSPSVDIPKYISDQIDKFIQRAQSVLHLKSEPRGAGNITATEKSRDAKNTEAFIKPISDQVWDLIAFIIESIGIMRYGVESYEEMRPKIYAARTFDVLEPEDYLAQINEAIQAKMPTIVIQNMIYEYMASVNMDDSDGQKIFNLIENADALLAVSPEQITLGQSRGTIQPWEVRLHQSSMYIIMKLIRENEGWLELDKEVKIQQIQDEAKMLIPQNEIALPEAEEI